MPPAPARAAYAPLRMAGMQRRTLRRLLAMGAVASVPVILLTTSNGGRDVELHNVPLSVADREHARERATVRERLREFVKDSESAPRRDCRGVSCTVPSCQTCALGQAALLQEI